SEHFYQSDFPAFLNEANEVVDHFHGAPFPFRQLDGVQTAGGAGGQIAPALPQIIPSRQVGMRRGRGENWNELEGVKWTPVVAAFSSAKTDCLLWIRSRRGRQ
ncbi:MAG: hypothetical protein AAF203_10260, partial [Pseudomonadota bacterium]